MYEVMLFNPTGLIADYETINTPTVRDAAEEAVFRVVVEQRLQGIKVFFAAILERDVPGKMRYMEIIVHCQISHTHVSIIYLPDRYERVYPLSAPLPLRSGQNDDPHHRGAQKHTEHQTRDKIM